MKIFLQMGTLAHSVLISIYFDKLEIANDPILIVELAISLWTIPSRKSIRINKKRTNQSLFIQTLVDSGIIIIIYALINQLRNGVSMAQ